jgi:hypothetical protein
MSLLREKLEKIPPPVRQWGLFAAWLAGLLLVGVLFWALTGPLRSRVMLTAVNKALTRAEAPYRLEAPVPALGKPGRAMQLGAWFTVGGSGSLAVVFPLMSGGSLLAVLAVAAPDGTVELITPLSLSAEQAFRELPEGTVRLYRNRIGESVRLLHAKLAAQRGNQ